MFFLIPSLVNITPANHLNDLSETSIKSRVKRNLLDTGNRQQYGDIGIDESDKTPQSFDDMLKRGEATKDMHQKLIDEENKKLDDMFKKFEDDVKKLSDTWQKYDESFESLLQKAKNISENRNYSSIKWHTKDSWYGTYEIMNGNKDVSVDVVIDKTVERYKGLGSFTKTSVLLNNGVSLAKFPGIVWQTKNHYVPYFLSYWDNNSIGIPGFFKNYMGPQFRFDKFITTFDGHHEVLLWTDVGQRYFSIGLYYDADRNEIKEAWDKLEVEKKSFFSQTFNLKDSFNALYKEIDFSKKIFEKSSKFYELKLNRRTVLLNTKYAKDMKTLDSITKVSNVTIYK